jgi:hypothetical protein
MSDEGAIYWLESVKTETALLYGERDLTKPAHSIGDTM